MNDEVKDGNVAETNEAAPVAEAVAPVKVGTKETEEMLIFLFCLGKIVKVSKESNGGFEMTDIGNLMMVIPTIGPALDNADQIIVEIKDIDSTEADHLITLIGEKTGELINKEDLVNKIIKGLAVAKALNEFIATF